MELKKLNREDAFEEWKYITELPEDENGLINTHMV